MLITPEIFLDSVILLIHNNSAGNKRIVTQLLKIAEDDQSLATKTEQNDLTHFYMKIARTLVRGEFDPSNKQECQHYLLQLKSSPALEKRRDLYELLSEVFLDRESLPVERLERVTTTLTNITLRDKLNKQNRRAFSRTNALDSMTDPMECRKELNAILNEMREFTTSKDNTEGASNALAGADRVSFGDKQSMLDAASKHTERSVTGVLKFGWKGLNMMFGSTQGLAQGETVVFAARSHNYKSGLLMSVAMWIPIYNVAPNTNGRIPLVLFVSVENEAYQNYVWIARKTYQTQTGKDPSALTESELMEWAFQKYKETGFEFEILRFLPENFGYEELSDLIEQYESQNYQIVALIVDYMNVMKKSGIGGNASQQAHHLAVKELYRRSCNLCKHKGISLITAHQLNRAADALVGSGKRNVVKSFTPENMSDSSDVHREVDTLVFLEIEVNHDGVPFLTLQRNKRRYDEVTPHAHKYFAMPFVGTRGLEDDIEWSKPGFTRSMYTWDVNDYPGDATPIREMLAASNASIMSSSTTPAENIF